MTALLSNKVKDYKKKKCNTKAERFKVIQVTWADGIA